MWGLVLYKTGKNNKVLSIKLYKLCRVAGQLVNTLKPCKMYEIYIYIRGTPHGTLPTPNTTFQTCQALQTFWNKLITATTLYNICQVKLCKFQKFYKLITFVRRN